MPTYLAQNEFISNPAMPTTGSAVAFSDPSGSAAAAAPNSALASAMTADTAAAPDLTDPPVAVAVLIHEPSMTNGGDQEAPAGRAPNTPSGAFGTEFIHEIFFYARKLMLGHQGFVLDEAAFMADVEETPLFLREDGYLRRREA